MNKEILILSQWLHEKGFECDFVMIDSFGLDSPTGGGVKLQTYLLFGGIGEDEAPWFSLNQTLKLLPEKIRKAEKYYVYGCEENYFKMDFYLGINKKGIGYISDNLGIKKDNAALWESVGKGSIHLSALRLLKKTVEEEYVNEKS